MTVPTARAIACFTAHLARIGMTDLCADETTSALLASTSQRCLREMGWEGFRGLAEALVKTGMRERWNDVLKQRRSAVLGSWVSPHVAGSLVDLLCGDGEVGLRLQERGIRVSFVERGSDYACDRRPLGDAFTELGLLRKHPVRADCVLLCTVLHHEVEPDSMIELAFNLARRRVIIVENTVEELYDADYHELVDRFFNECLNASGLACPMNHRRVEGWVRACSNYGRIVLTQRRDDVPGIPLPHQLVVLDKR